MEYVFPIGGEADDAYVNADPSAGVEGSAVPAEAIEHPQREIVAVIAGAGLEPDGDNLAQLLAAIQALIEAKAYAKGLALAGLVLSLQDEEGNTLNSVELPGASGYGAALSLAGRVLSLLDEEANVLDTQDLPGVELGTAVASTSGVAIDFTGLPSGVRRVVVHFIGVSTSSTSPLLVQARTSGGVVSSGYSGYSHLVDGASSSTHSAGIVAATSVAAAALFTGKVVLSLADATTNTWVYTVHMYSSSAGTFDGMGSVTLSGEITGVRITTAGGSDTFDAGKINISYEL